MKWISCLLLFFCSFAVAKDSEREIFVPVRNAEIFCRVVGEGDPIIVIHGGPGLSQDYLYPQLKQLGEDYLVIFYDQRSCGRSTGELNSETICVTQFLEDIDAIRETFGFEKVTLMGHSWGGFLAANYAVLSPEKVEKLVLLNSMPLNSDDVFLFLNEWKQKMEPIQKELESIEQSVEFREGNPSVFEKYYRLIFGVYCFRTADVNQLDLRMTSDAYLNGLRVNLIFRETVFMNPFDLREKLQQLQMPVMIVHGENDLIPPVTAENIHNVIGSSEYVLLKECGHFPYVEVPEEFFAELNAFLKGG